LLRSGVLLINKRDLFDIWEVDEPLLSSLREQFGEVYPCSSRGGITLHTAIESLAKKMWGVK
jgi:hypothetical protein